MEKKGRFTLYIWENEWYQTARNLIGKSNYDLGDFTEGSADYEYHFDNLEDALTARPDPIVFMDCLENDKYQISSADYVLVYEEPDDDGDFVEADYPDFRVPQDSSYRFEWNLATEEVIVIE